MGATREGCNGVGEWRSREPDPGRAGCLLVRFGVADVQGALAYHADRVQRAEDAAGVRLARRVHDRREQAPQPCIRESLVEAEVPVAHDGERETERAQPLERLDRPREDFEP